MNYFNTRKTKVRIEDRYTLREGRLPSAKGLAKIKISDLLLSLLTKMAFTYSTRREGLSFLHWKKVDDHVGRINQRKGNFSIPESGVTS